jgi:mannose-6-phosphate isomerase-like protein (cupin superfamily)
LSKREIACEDLNLAIDELKGEGFRLDLIYPADDPSSAVLSKAGDTVRVSTPGAAPLPDGLPLFKPEFVLTRAGADAGQGRAGMLYRDLLPSRLGGRYIASHIAIPGGGPVSDWVHFHRIALQVIYVRSGWVRVVYEDQGDPFVMEEGDLVVQPPLIRHRVLESSPGLEVIEITAPALHETFADHDMALPNGKMPPRLFSGQHFLRHVAAQTAWSPFGSRESQETGVGAATGGLGEVSTIRPGEASSLAFEPHEGELVFGFVLAGSANLDYRGTRAIEAEDAFAIPPGESWTLAGMSDDFRLLHVTTARLDAGA